MSNESHPKSPAGDLVAKSSSEVPVVDQEPPVVARLIVEIRSDGAYTIARGAMEDALSGQRVAIEATGSTPLALALSLARRIAGAPWLARSAIRALVRKR